MRATALLACHNRRDHTLECLRSFFDQVIPTTAELDAVLVDDGSVDGTADAVRAQFPRVTVVPGPGDLYWARAMAVAEDVALEREPDFLLWLNDDVVLDPRGLAKLLDAAASHPEPCVVVGAVRDSATGGLSYSGVRRRGRHPLRMELVDPREQPVKVETFNGNVLLVPADAADRVGRIDGDLVHAAADFDYGLRARRAGVVNLLAPGTVGECELNPATTPWLDGSVGARERLRILFGPKGLPPRSRARYLRRHGGAMWPAYWLMPYLRAVPGAVLAGGRTSPGDGAA
jgi:GT2 family glycosyltransferase